ncbi:MAG: RING finger domain-containing protein, partial [Candidatus Heimdallarchaeaceae archaeon]
GILNFILPRYFHIIGAGLILINIIFHFRKEFLELFKTIGRILETIFRAWWRLIKQVPKLIKRFLDWLIDPERFIRMMKWIWDKIKWIGRAIRYVFIRNYFILFVFGIALFFILRDILIFEVRLALTSLVCLVSVIKPLLDWREHFGEDINSARLFLYRTSHKVGTRIKRETFDSCPYCSFRTTKTALDCWNCGNQIPRCMICNNRVAVETEIVKCTHCENIYHEDHLRTWMRFNNKCPVCKEEIKKIKTEAFTIPADAVSQAS